jgi:hypothetical protein|tara:strand:- start:6230 stop:6436 length:207 start_codon:yes stop_codon:yes gene_type:complete
MSVEPSALRENFTTQLETAISEIKNLEAQVVAKRELALKLKGALEALDLVDPPAETEEPVEAEPVAAE